MDRYQHDTASLADLISQLEEDKFLRLFRFLTSNRACMSNLLDPETTTGQPLNLPDVQIHKFVGERVSSLQSLIVVWLFQLVHLPAFLWGTDLVDKHFKQALLLAFKNLSENPTLLATIGDRFVGDAPRSWLQGTAEGYDYYLFTNVCREIDDPSLSLLTDSAHKLFECTSGLSRDSHPRFGIGTPETLAGFAPELVRQFIVDLMKLPSSYYLLAREGRISIVPITEHGVFLSSDTVRRDKSAVWETTVTSNLHWQCSPLGRAVSTLEELLNLRTTKEADIQSFLQEHPQVLFSLDERYCELKPHVCLSDSKQGRLIPDFMIRIEDSSVWDVVELKLPTDSLILRNSNEMMVSAPAARAVAELLRYRDYFGIRKNRNKATKLLGGSPYEPSLVLLIGRGHARKRFRWSSDYAGIPNVTAVSYDYLLQRAKDFSSLLSTNSKDK